MHGRLTMYENQLARRSTAEFPARRANERELGLIGLLRQFGRMRTHHHVPMEPGIPRLMPKIAEVRS
jgi:hypothetical protein